MVIFKWGSDGNVIWVRREEEEKEKEKQAAVDDITTGISRSTPSASDTNVAGGDTSNTSTSTCT